MSNNHNFLESSLVGLRKTGSNLRLNLMKNNNYAVLQNHKNHNKVLQKQNNSSINKDSNGIKKDNNFLKQFVTWLLIKMKVIDKYSFLNKSMKSQQNKQESYHQNSTPSKIKTKNFCKKLLPQNYKPNSSNYRSVKWKDNFQLMNNPSQKWLTHNQQKYQRYLVFLKSKERKWIN